MGKRVVSKIIVAIFIVGVLCLSPPAVTRAGDYAEIGDRFLPSPVRIDFTYDGNLVVSDYQTRMVLTVSPRSLKILHRFQVQGRPLGIAYAMKYVLVGNQTKKTVEIYKLNGKKVGSLGGPAVEQPTDIAVDIGSKRIFVVDGGQKAVKVFNVKGRFLYTIPASPPDAAVLTNPTGITLDTVQKEVLVSDYGDRTQGIYARVQIFDYSGNLLDTISGKSGMFGERFSRPQGLAVDNAGHLFLADCFSGEVQVYDRNSGTLLKALGGYGTDPGQLRLPLDLVLEGSSKNIYVTNNRCCRIEVFKEGGTL